jgi:hypothetical protein
MNNRFSPGKPAPKKSIHFGNNLIESFGGIGKSITSAIKDDVIKGGSDNILNSLLGTNNEMLSANQSNLEYQNRDQKENNGFDKDLFSVKESGIIERGIAEKIEEVRRELLGLKSSMQKLNTELEKAIVENVVEPGIYHLNYFEQIKALIILIKKQVDESSTWLQMMQSRGKKRIGYWGMFKKHGTNFGLSNERNLATSHG